MDIRNSFPLQQVDGVVSKVVHDSVLSGDGDDASIPSGVFSTKIRPGR